MKHYFKNFFIFLCICVALIAYSCSEEKDFVKEQNRISNVNLEDLPILQKELNKDKRKGSYSKESIQYYLDKINTKNIIQILDQQGLKSYTFGLNYKKQDTLFNLCAKETAEGYNYTLLKYSTTNLEEWVQDIQNTGKSLIIPEIKGEKIDDRVAYSPVCVRFNPIRCPSGLHGVDQIGECDYPFVMWIATYDIIPCNNGGGGGGGIGGAAPTNPDPLATNHDPIITTAPNVEFEDNDTPCDKLEDKLDPAKANLKPIIIGLQGTFNQNGENGTSLLKTESGIYNNIPIPSTSKNGIKGRAGLIFYGEIHTHPPQGPYESYPMFSWTDVARLINLKEYAGDWNQSEIVMIGVFKDDFGMYQTYAIVFNTDGLSNNTVESILDNPEFNSCTNNEKCEDYDEQL